MDSKNGLIRYIQIILDIAVMFLSYLIAIKIKFGSFQAENVSSDSRYLTLYIIEMFAYLVVFFVFFDGDELITRNAGKELMAILKLFLYVIAFTTVIIYFTKSAEYYSRIQMALFFTISYVCIFLERQWLKRLITKSYHRSGANEKIMLITTNDCVEDVVARIKETRNWYFRISNIALIDADRIGDVVNKIEIVANKENLMERIATEEIDSVFLCLPNGTVFDRTHFMHEARAMGKTVHINIPEFDAYEGKRRIQSLGKFAVVSWPEKHYRIRHTVIKRVIDILIGLLGTILMLVFLPWIALAHVIEGDAGHSIVQLVKVGKNGRRFYQRKFRTIHRKKMQLSHVGKVLQSLGIAFLPQAWNVLWGDMSIVGAKAPSLPEFLSYSKEHRRSLSLKPGVTGYWAFEEDEEQADIRYIEKTGLKTDLEIAFRTLFGFLFVKNRKNKEMRNLIRQKEEILFLQYWMEENKPLEYTPLSANEQRQLAVSPLYRGIKRLFDIVASFLGLILLSPLFLILAMIVKWEDGGSVFYGHTRVGKNGKKISVYKFRSMRMNVGDLEKILTPEQLEQYKREFKLENDPRVTRFGNILRKSSLDELPQLFNILKGDLSIVGPRPIVEEETKIYKDDIAKILCATPGLTGYWQAYARNNATYESGERQRMEMFYIEHRSLGLDIKILFRTVISVVKRDGAE